MNASTHAPDPLATLTIDPESATPPFRQLQDAVVSAIRDGSLLPGQRLPTTRALAAHLGLAVNTVASAYRALEQAGIVEGRGRAGTFVRLGDDPVHAEARRLAQHAAEALSRLGIDPERAAALLAEAYATLPPGPQGP